MADEPVTAPGVRDFAELLGLDEECERLMALYLGPVVSDEDEEQD